MIFKQVTSKFSVIGVIGFCLFNFANVNAKDTKPLNSSSSEVSDFAEKMAKEHGFDAAVVKAQLSALKVREDIIARITKPAEAMPWYKYRKIWMKEKRIQGGVDFWNKHAETLAKAEKEFGVDAAVIVAIIGVESYYGRIQGSFPVMDALYTLGFHYPKRSKFFRSELAQFYLLAREQGWPLNDIKGSYAGAMGMGQFISSSYRHYGFDFNKDGKVNLFSDPIDMIGSVANYFAKHGWKKEKFVAQVVGDNQKIKALSQTALKLNNTLSSLEKAGVKLAGDVMESGKFGIFKFEVSEGKYNYWAVGDNFYTITRYNRSHLYALAVYQLSEAIKAKKSATENVE